VSVIEAVTVVRYRAKIAIGERRRKLRGVKRLAYRDAAWAKIRERCRCAGDGPERKPCRYHDKEFRAEDVPSRSYEEEGWHGFIAPVEWGLPRREEPGFWDYGRAVAYRLARFYAHLDRRASPPPGAGAGNEGMRGEAKPQDRNAGRVPAHKRPEEG
jgi:hypothetical protein